MFWNNIAVGYEVVIQGRFVCCYSVSVTDYFYILALDLGSAFFESIWGCIRMQLYVWCRKIPSNNANWSLSNTWTPKWVKVCHWWIPEERKWIWTADGTWLKWKQTHAVVMVTSHIITSYWLKMLTGSGSDFWHTTKHLFIHFNVQREVDRSFN